MQFNCKMGYSGNEQDYQLLKTSLSELKKYSNQKEVLRYLTNVLPNPTDIVTLDNAQNTVKSVKAQLANKNLFDKNNANIIAGYPDAENVINPASTTKSVYIPCAPNTTYTVSKVVTARFAVAFTDVLPANGVAVTGKVQNNTATSITSTSSANSRYIVVWIYHSNYDTSITVDEVLATLQIEEGSTATAYTPYISDFSTVKVKTYRKNLFDNNKLSEWGLTLSDGKYTGNVGLLNAKTLFSSFKSNTRYTISVKASNLSKSSATLLIIINYTDGTTQTVIRVNSTTESVYSFTSTANKSISNITSTYYDVDTINIAYIQIEEGTTATEYEPYQGQTYTPTATGEVTGITVLTPTTNIINDKGLLFTKVTGDDFNYIN